MIPTHHPSDATLADYASGALRAPFSNVVSAHLGFCPHCRSAVGRLEAVGFAMIDALPPSPLAPGRLGRAMAALNETDPSDNEPAGVVFQAARRGSSVHLARDPTGSAMLYLLRLRPAEQVPPHGHAGLEFTTVLEGAYRDGDATYAVGDFCELDESHTHHTEVVSDADCVCMIASAGPTAPDVARLSG